MLTVLVVIAVVIAAVLLYASTRPDQFEISRSTTINAPPERIAALVNDFRRWPLWSPYEKLDPNLKRTVAGSESGKGATYAWEGNGKAGKGAMEILDATPAHTVIRLDFEKPFKANNTAEFTYTPASDGTVTTWTMRGVHPFMGKVMCLFFSMDNLVGKDFAAGLASLKQAAEKN